MMILSRIWYVILGLLLAAAYYVVSLAVGQYNRRNQAAMDETLKADSQVVSWALQVDARRRLDTLLLAAVDANVGKALTGANGKENVPPASRDEGSAVGSPRRATSSWPGRGDCRPGCASGPGRSPPPCWGPRSR